MSRFVTGGVCILLSVVAPRASGQEAATSAPASVPMSQPASQPSSLVSSQPSTIPVEAMTPAPKKEEPKPAKGLVIGSQGRLSIGGLFQGWFDSNATADKFTANADAVNTFRVRRAEINLSGEIVPKKFGFRLMTDLAKGLFNQETKTVVTGVETTTDPVTGEVTTTTTTTTVTGVKADNVVPVRDLFGVFKTEKADIWFGQYKIPLSLEGLGSPAQLLLPERSVASKTFGDKRDFGVKVEKRFEEFKNAYYSVGIFNGSGENKLDTDAVKDLMWRFEAVPEIKHAKILVAFVGAQSLTGETPAASRRVLEGDLRVNAGPFVLQSELFVQHARAASDGPTPADPKDALGFYAAAGYQQKHFLVAGRVGLLDPDTAIAASDDAGQMMEFGASASYFLWRNEQKPSPLYSEHPEIHEAKFQVGYSHFAPTSTSNKATDELIIAVQSWF